MSREWTGAREGGQKLTGSHVRPARPPRAACPALGSSSGFACLMWWRSPHNMTSATPSISGGQLGTKHMHPMQPPSLTALPPPQAPTASTHRLCELISSRAFIAVASCSICPLASGLFHWCVSRCIHVVACQHCRCPLVTPHSAPCMCHVLLIYSSIKADLTAPKQAFLQGCSFRLLFHFDQNSFHSNYLVGTSGGKASVACSVMGAVDADTRVLPLLASPRRGVVTAVLIEQ